ncbi:50S ribosomal protein L3 [Candidatus Saccharibacteria bacterium]|nr:50S ribosomal protein L3 [Candidatus Saccharibacteria bacterium]
MIDSFYTKKIGMTQVFDQAGLAVPVTVLQLMDNKIVGYRDQQKDGYQAYRVEYQLKPKKSLIRESRVDSDLDQSIKSIDLSILEVGSMINAQATSRGRGFIGTIKRYNFKRGPMTHGSHNKRRPGSIGSLYPQHVFKGQKMAGRGGQDNATIKNLEVIELDQENNLILVKGSVPGKSKAIVRLEVVR